MKKFRILIAIVCLSVLSFFTSCVDADEENVSFPENIENATGGENSEINDEPGNP